VTSTECSASSRTTVAADGDLPVMAPGSGPGESVHGAGPGWAVVQAAEGTLDAQVIAGATAAVRRLLAAYASTLDVLDGLPVTPMVATRWHWWSRPSTPIRLPRISWMLRSLTLWHIDRVLTGAERIFRRRSALGIAGSDEADALDAVTEFRASLPSRSRVLRIGALAVAALVVAHVLATLLLHLNQNRVGASVPSPANINWISFSAITNQLLDRALGAMSNINQLLGSALGALQLPSSSAGLVLDALFKASPAVLAAAAGLVSLSLYLILWPVACAFRLKRLLLNLYPHADSKLRTTPASWSMTRSTGVYDLEQETFAKLGARVPREPPLDLLVSLPIPICWISLCSLWVYFVAISTGLAAGLPVVLILAGFVLLFYITPAAIRLAWLAAAWRARNGRPRSAWLFGDDVSVPWRSKPVRCRSPLLIGWLSLMLPYTCLIIWWLWWSTTRDLRELGRAYDVNHLRGMHPAAQALAAGPGVVLYGLPALIVLSRAPRYVREAQAATGLERPVPRHIAWLVLIWPVLCVRLQRELNRLWQGPGIRIDQHDEAIDLAARPAV